MSDGVVKITRIITRTEEERGEIILTLPQLRMALEAFLGKPIPVEARYSIPCESCCNVGPFDVLAVSWTIRTVTKE